jgi:DNA-binding NarL/FixJ family response regulator
MPNGTPRILFVDDDPRLLSGLRRGLRDDAGRWALTFCADPLEALALFRREPFDVVVADFVMPRMTGLEMVVAMREVSSDTMAIMLTGSADLQVAMDAVNVAGIFRFHTKPCSVDLLRDSIATAVGVRRVAGSMQEARPQTGRSPDRAAFERAALDYLSVGVLVVDSEGRVMLSNKRAGLLLSERDGLLLSGMDICRASAAEQTKELQALIRRASGGAGEAGADTGVLALERPSGRRSLTVVVAPYETRADETGDRYAILFVADPEEHPLPEPATLAKLFGLSRAEAIIAHALTSGSTLDEAAESAGVTLNTARTYLKQVFLKTGTGRQSELVKLVLTSPAISVLGDAA